MNRFPARGAAAALLACAAACAPAWAQQPAAGAAARPAPALSVQIRVYTSAKGQTPAEDWVLKTAQMQFFEGKTAGPVAALSACTEWLTLKPDMAAVMDSAALGALEARVRPAREPGKLEVFARIRTGKSQSALYVRVAAEPGARAVSRIVSGFDRPDVYIAVRVPPAP
jgi:hypothetical protein